MTTLGQTTTSWALPQTTRRFCMFAGWAAASLTTT